MKKRSNDAKLNPDYNASGRSGNAGDRQLIQRVEQASVYSSSSNVVVVMLSMGEGKASIPTS